MSDESSRRALEHDSDYDGAWKEALREHLAEFVEERKMPYVTKDSDSGRSPLALHARRRFPNFAENAVSFWGGPPRTIINGPPVSNHARGLVGRFDGVLAVSRCPTRVGVSERCAPTVCTQVLDFHTQPPTSGLRS